MKRNTNTGWIFAAFVMTAAAPVALAVVCVGWWL